MSVIKFLKLGASVAAIGLVVAVGGSYVAPIWFAPRQNVHVDSADPVLIEKGRHIAQASDCVACHTAPGGKPFAGGLAMQTPIGAIYSTNITPDKGAGIGGYDFADFERAVRHGVRKDGSPLYPAMPYVSYSVLTDEDVQALYAYFVSGVQPVAQQNHDSTIPWPTNMRWPLAWWQMLFGGQRSFTPPEGATPEIARGAYLVEGAGHCGACHTPRGAAFQEKALKDGPDGEFLSGSELEGWFAKSLRHEDVGLASWSQQEIADFLKTGRNARTAAFGSMAEVVQHSAQHLSDADASAIAAYLAGRAARPGHAASATKAEDITTAKLYDGADHSPGALGYVARCAPCHRMNGQGAPRLFPALAGNAVVTTVNPSSLIQITLAGGAMAKTPADKTHPSMPELAKLDDGAVADILSFIRNSWGNKASPVSASDVAAMRGVIAGKPLDYVPENPPASHADDVKAGQALALDRVKGNCLACHTLKGGDAPSSVGRELVDMKRRFPNRADLVEILTDESIRNPIAPMPSLGRNHVLTPAEIEKIIDFLYTL
ncbi:c-type cytochrome [Rhodoblastus sp. 17X3]|uniref:c-type cytochrome n=1 Tax=Rhodoblastus sp. 17X3 TaxID=3047026 RepID=UPI0024B77B5E|nr:c-type cytochrome [Rhodoblastus sp. 17X3]MDI9850081.1 c-type cytochrome [Rhodoblastus sp. 17X3]